MDGRKVILFIVTLSVVIIISIWFLGQNFIDQQDPDEIETEIIN